MKVVRLSCLPSLKYLGFGMLVKVEEALRRSMLQLTIQGKPMIPIFKIGMMALCKHYLERAPSTWAHGPIAVMK